MDNNDSGICKEVRLDWLSCQDLMQCGQISEIHIWAEHQRSLWPNTINKHKLKKKNN